MRPAKKQEVLNTRGGAWGKQLLETDCEWAEILKLVRT